MEKEIIVGSKKYLIRELLASELDDVDWDDKKLALKCQVIASCGISEDEYSKLTVRERLSIIKTINELNGVGDFQ